MELYDLFARVLEPPGPSLSGRVNECLGILTPSWENAAGLMYRFKTFVEQTPMSRMEKIYAETFSLGGGLLSLRGLSSFWRWESSQAVPGWIRRSIPGL